MIDDVESFVMAAEVLKERGAYKIYVLATHGLLSSDAPRLLEDSAIDEVCHFIKHIHINIFFRFIKYFDQNNSYKEIFILKIFKY